MSGASVPGLNREQVEKAAKALLTYAQKKGQESSNLLLDDELIYLVRIDWQRTNAYNLQAAPGDGGLEVAHRVKVLSIPLRRILH